MSEDVVSLSAPGLARKDEILRVLLSAQRRRRGRRRAGRAGAASLALLVAGLGAWAGLRGPAPVRMAAATLPAPAITDEPGAFAAWITRNDPGVVARYTDAGNPACAEVIGDRELDALLVRSGRVPGFIRAPGRFLLASDVRQPAQPGKSGV